MTLQGYCWRMHTSNAASRCWCPLWRSCHTNSWRYVSNSCLVVPNWRRNLRLARIHRFSTFWVCTSGCSGSTKFCWWTTTSWRYTPPFSCDRLLYAAHPSDMMWVPGRHHCWMSGCSVCAVLSGTTSIMQRPLSLSVAPKTHRPLTRRPLWNFRRKKYDSSISTTMGWPLLSKPPSCRGFRRISSAQMSRMKFPQSTAVLGDSVSCQVTWCKGISVAHENKNQTSFPKGTLLLKKEPSRRLCRC